MKVEMKRSRNYGGKTLEAGRVADVDETFGRWLIAKGFAVPYTSPISVQNVREIVKRGRQRKGS